MQEEVTQKTIALVIKTAKLDTNVLKAAMRMYLNHRRQKAQKTYALIMVLQRRKFVMRRSLYFRSILFEIFGQVLMYQFQLFYFLLKRNVLSI